MKAAIVGFLLVIFITGYHGQQKDPQSSDIQRTGQQSREKTVTPISQSTSAEQEGSAYQATKKYFGRAFGPEYLAAWVLVIIGAAGVLAAIYTLRAIQRQAEIMESQLIVAHRAYLGIIEPEQPIDEGGKTYAKFPVINHGHIGAQITNINVEVIIQQKDGKEVFRNADEPKVTNAEIPPEKFSSYILTACWPLGLPHAAAIVLSFNITYYTGFKESGSDVLSFVRVFLPEINKWQIGYWGIDIDLINQKGKKNPS